MHEDMNTLLNAYLDNELQGKHLKKMELHLASCQACRKELQELRILSERLREAPLPEFMPAERFISTLAHNMPRRTVPDRLSKPGSLAWWLVPAGLLTTWIFVHTVFTLTNMINAAGATGLLGRASSFFATGQAAAWYELVIRFSGGQMGVAQGTLMALNDFTVLGGSLLAGFLWQAVIVLLYFGWLAAWWFRGGLRHSNMTATSSQF